MANFTSYMPLTASSVPLASSSPSQVSLPVTMSLRQDNLT